MKVNRWTLGLAAVGLVSLSPNLLAQTPMPAPAPAPAMPAAPVPVPVTTALSATTISGYVDTSAVWNPGTGNANPAPYSFNKGKQDGFNIDSVDFKIAKPEDEGQWAAGYTLELMGGPDATGVATGTAYALGNSDFYIRQAFVTLRTPVGNGIDWTIGRWDNLLGYEGSDSYKNPNWTRSYGYTIEPTEHTGVLASYKFSDAISLQVGVANEVTTQTLNARNASGTGGNTIESKKALVSLLTLTAPDSWGAWKGSQLFAGLDYGAGNAAEVGGTHNVDKTHVYVGATINTPINNLTVGGALDTVNNMDVTGVEGYALTIAGYASYKVTDKMTLNTRGEFVQGSAFDQLFSQVAILQNGAALPTSQSVQNTKVFALTETIQYDLWANVISRLEFRWDTSLDGSAHFGANTLDANNVFANNTGFAPTKRNDFMVAANIVYKF